MTNNTHLSHVDAKDVLCIEKVQGRLWRAKKKLGNWRAVGEKLGVDHTHVWRLAKEGVVPANPDIRALLTLPKSLPSERSPRKLPAPKIGADGWEDHYFKKVR